MTCQWHIWIHALPAGEHRPPLDVSPWTRGAAGDILLSYDKGARGLTKRAPTDRATCPSGQIARRGSAILAVREPHHGIISPRDVCSTPLLAKINFRGLRDIDRVRRVRLARAGWASMPTRTSEGVPSMAPGSASVARSADAGAAQSRQVNDERSQYAAKVSGSEGDQDAQDIQSLLPFQRGIPGDGGHDRPLRRHRARGGG